MTDKAHDLRDGWRSLVRSRSFLAGLALKLVLSVSFGSHFATRWFAPFVHDFVSHGGDPWSRFLAAGEPLAFPYGPAMLGAFALPFLPAAAFSFAPAGHLALFLLRVPVLLADVTILLLLAAWLRDRRREVLLTWWWNPIVLYASYVHGQLDLVPTALLVLATWWTFRGRVWAGAVVLGVAVACKLHLLVALAFLGVALLRARRSRIERFGPPLLTLLLAVLAYLPLAAASPAFAEMVFGTPQAARLWSMTLPMGPDGPVVHLAPAALLLVWLRFTTMRRLNRELVLLFLGLAYAVLVALVPPMPGWFVWSAPFLAFHAARYARSGFYALLVVSAAYLAYFVSSDPAGTLELLDPSFGAGAGARVASSLTGAAPFLFDGRATNLAWTVLFVATWLVCAELLVQGITRHPLYTFRSESFMLGVAGDSASGKHTLAGDLSALLGPSLLTVLYGDDDHRWERGDPNWARYTHLDPRGNRLADQSDQLQALRRGARVDRRSYDHETGRFGSATGVSAGDFVAIVGLHPFFLGTQRDALHLKVFLDPEESDRRRWKMARDVKERGKSEAAVEAELARRADDATRFVRPQRSFADLIIRARPIDPEDPARVDVSFELVGGLVPLVLAERLESLGSVQVAWRTDETLSRDTLEVSGRVDAAALWTAARAIPSPLDDTLLGTAEGWQPGTRGVVQLALYHSILRRLAG